MEEATVFGLYIEQSQNLDLSSIVIFCARRISVLKTQILIHVPQGTKCFRVSTRFFIVIKSHARLAFKQEVTYEIISYILIYLLQMKHGKAGYEFILYLRNILNEAC